MLTQLSIKNFGLIDDLSIEFDERLNILTGETGAGKSIIIGALRISLGHKLNVSQLRLSDQPCVIEVVFDLTKNKLYKIPEIQEFIDADDPTLVIQRTLTPEGRNKIKINGQAVNIGQLKSIGNYLMDFHGPHDHQMLLVSENHLGILDQLCDFKDSLQQYKKTFKTYSEIKHKIDELSSLTQTRERELDLLTHQINELKQVPLDANTYQDVVQQKVKVDNALKLNESVMSILNLLDEGPSSSSESIGQSFSAMKQLNRLDDNTEGLANELAQLQDMHNSLVSSLRDYTTSLQFDENQAEEIHHQSDIYEEILRKYGPTIEDANTFYTEAQEKFDLLSNLENNDRDLKEQLKNIEEELGRYAKDVTKERQKRAKALKKTIEKELKELGIAHIQFEAKIDKGVYQDTGCDNVEFYISPNAGEDLKPMAEIVSSGEAARVMLGLKKALIEVDPIPVLVFDEIDAQIGGRLGTITGEKLRDISKYRQVLLITHLPQIASFANVHFKVRKLIKDSRSVTEVQSLNQKERIAELSQMMSGEKESAVSVKHAKDMLEAAKS